jgi:hypothetical protein
LPRAHLGVRPEAFGAVKPSFWRTARTLRSRRPNTRFLDYCPV